MNLICLISTVSLLLSYAYAPVPRPVGSLFQFGYNIPVLAAITEPTEAEERA